MPRLLSLALAALLAASLLGAPASAAPRPPDPEVARPAAPADGASPVRAAPASIDSDVYVYASSPTGRIYFVVTGRLRLTLKPGSTTAYRGNLVDYTGQKSYRASADTSDASAPVIKLESNNGKFTFTSTLSFGTSFYSGAATSKPKKLKVGLAQIVLGATTHSVRTASYSIVLTERSGALSGAIEHPGTLTMAYDANGRISGGQVTVTNAKGKVVTHALKNSGYFSSTYFYTVAQVDKTYFGLTATISGTSLSGYAFAAAGSRTSQWALSGAA